MENKQQWKKRIEIFRYIYTNIIDPIEPKTFTENAFSEYDFSADQLLVIEYFAKNQNEINQLVKNNIGEKWSWERIKPILKAIIFSAYSEYKTLNIAKKIVIDQAIINTKKYSDFNDYKFVNAILDKIII